MKRFLVGLNVVLLVCAGLPEGHSQTFTPGQVLTAGALNTAFALANTNASAVQAASLQKTNNLSDLNNAATARNNLGLGTAATQPYSAFDVNGAATAAIAGQMPGNALTATYAVGAGTASNVPYTGLTGSVPTWNQNTTGTAGNTSNVSGQTAAAVAAAAVMIQSATASNVPSTIVMRDSNGNINAGVITPWTIIAASGTSTTGAAEWVNTSAYPITITLPASSPNATVTYSDYKGTYATNNLTINAPTGVPINGLSGTPASVTVSTSFVSVTCVYVDSVVGYNCKQF